jgi:hypothetical protein
MISLFLIIALMQIGTVHTLDVSLADLTAQNEQYKLRILETKSFSAQKTALEECAQLKGKYLHDFRKETCLSVAASIMVSLLIYNFHLYQDMQAAKASPYGQSTLTYLRNRSVEWGLLVGTAVGLMSASLIKESFKRYSNQKKLLSDFGSNLELLMINSHEVHYEVEVLRKHGNSINTDNFDRKWNSDFRIKLGALYHKNSKSAQHIFNTIRQTLEVDARNREITLTSLFSLFSFMTFLQIAHMKWENTLEITPFTLLCSCPLIPFTYKVINNYQVQFIKNQLRAITDFESRLQQ